MGLPMDDLTDVLIGIVTDFIDDVFELPIYMFVVSRNGSLAAARYEGNPLAGGTKVHVFTQHLEDNRWDMPINCFFVDGTGQSEVVKIDQESFTDTAETTHEILLIQKIILNCSPWVILSKAKNLSIGLRMNSVRNPEFSGH